MDKKKLTEGAIAYLAEDASIAISGVDTDYYSGLEHEEDDERLGTIKSADYNKVKLLAETLNYHLEQNFSNALSLQSKKPLYAIENPGAWFTLNTSENIKVTHLGKNASFPSDLSNIECYSKSLEELLELQNTKLQYIFLVSNYTEDNYGRADDEVGDDVVAVAYIFKNDSSKKYYILKNTIVQDTVEKGYFRTFTVFKKSIIKWEETAGKARKYLADVEGADKDIYYVSVKIGENKAKKALLIDTRERCTITPKALQTKILALQTLKPSIEQLKIDMSPSWVAKRLDYNEYGIATEDVNLSRNGQSYYWDIGRCWKIRDNSVAAIDQARKEGWYWEVAPYLPNGTDKDSLIGNDTDKGIFEGDTDVIASNGGTKGFTTNVLPNVIASKAYAMIIDDPEFSHSKFYTNGKKGVYFMSSQACDKTYANKSDLQTNVMGKIKPGQLIHPYDLETAEAINNNSKKYTCFINDDANTPNNGLLVESKEKIFDVYFLTKGTYSQKDSQVQYDILEPLKNGRRENTIDENGVIVGEGQQYVAAKYKDWIKNGPNPDEEKLYRELLTKASEEQKKEEREGIIETFILTKEEFENSKKEVEGAQYYLYAGLEPNKEYKRYRKDLQDKTVIEYDSNGEEHERIIPYSQYAGNIVWDIDTTEKYSCPVELIPCTYEFTVHETPNAIHNDAGALVYAQWILSFGYNQERIANFKPFDIFKDVFKEFNKDSISRNVKENNKREVPWWDLNSQYVVLNDKFVKQFFTKDKYGHYKLKEELHYDSEEAGIDGFDVKLNYNKEQVQKIKDDVKKAIKESSYIADFIDSKVDYVYDQFYNMVCEVWGNTDSDGIRRTKGYCVKGTPFEIKEIEKENGTITQTGFDAKDLLDYILTKALSDLGEREITRYIFFKLRAFFNNNKYIKIDQKEFEKIINIIEDGAKEAAFETSNRKEGEITDPEIQKRKALQIQNATHVKFREALFAAKVWYAGAITATALGALIYINGAAVSSAVVTAAATALSSATFGAVSSTSILGAWGFVAAGSASIPVVGWIVAAVIVIAVVITLIVTYFISKSKKEKNEKTIMSDDYVYKFTCRAKRAIKQYSITARGPLQGPKHNLGANAAGNNYEFGDAEKYDAYYNWIAQPGHGVPGSDEYKNNELFDTYCSGSPKILDLKEPYDGRVMVIMPSTEEAISDDDAYSMFNSSALQKIEEFIQTWMGKKDSSAIAQAEIPIQSYYDVYSGMHPYIEVGFRMGLGVCGRKTTEDGTVFLDEKGEPLVYLSGNNKYKATKDEEGNFIKGDAISDENEFRKICNSNFKTLNSRDYPYFQRMTIADNGVKKLNLTLFDPNFASYTTGIENYKGSEEVISLEALIRGALRNPVFIQDETIEKYNNDGNGEIKPDYLSIDETLYVSPTNLKIRYGYDDYQQTAKDVSEYFNINGKSLLANQRRWYDTEEWGTIGDNYRVTKAKKMIENKKIVNTGGDWRDVKWQTTSKDVETISSNKGSDKNNGFEEMIRAWAQTCVKSRTINFMITNFKSTLKNNGIQYDIEAIESKDANIMRTRFLQRYAEITANPEEVLYILMHMFNEDNDGNNVKASRVKIILISDDGDFDVPAMRDKLNMEYDYKMINEEDLDGTETQNIYEKAYQEEELEINENLLKKITLTLGGASATKNYGSSTESYRPLYKTLAQLMNEFCSLCPPKKLAKTKEHYDLEGVDILSNQKSVVSRPLKWFSVEDEENDTTYVCLYYRTVMKVPRIRVYTWGPNNPTPSCVKSISIKNENEFGVLAGIRSFDGEKGQAISRTNSVIQTEFKEAVTDSKTVLENEQPWKKNGTVYGTADYVGLNAKMYDNAFASSMYTGEMEVLGDPFWTFDGLLQPCTLPIKLNVVMPQSEFTRMADAKGEYQEQINSLRNTFNQREQNGQYWYNEGADLVEGKNPYDEKEDYYKIRQFSTTNVHQVLHEMSGYYVVKTIVHEITPTSYTTKLGIMSYPNIQDDVLLTKEQYNILNNKQ